jgi:hypothetical protein
MKKKNDTPIFREHPTLWDGEEEALLPKLANALTVVQWLKSEPDTRSLKVAAIVEATTKCRATILDRILGRLFKLEKAETLQRLMALK